MADEEKQEAAAEEEAKPEASPEAEAAPAETEAPAEAAAEAAPSEGAPSEAGGPVLTAREIEKMNVPKLKEAALQYGGRIQGVHGMDKAQLVRTLKEINGIPLQEPKRASNIDRTSVKQKIRTLKNARAQALTEKNRVHLKRARKRIKALRRKLVRSA